MMEVITTYKIESKDLADLIVTAFEGGSTHWCESAELTLAPEYEPTADQLGVVQYSHPQVYDGEYQFKVIYDDNQRGKLIGPKEMQIGMELFANKSPKHFWDFIEENYDAETADVFWQYVVLGDVVYG